MKWHFFLKGILFIFSLTISTIFLKADSNSSTDIFGYLENRFFLVGNRDVSWDDFNEKFKLGDYNRLRLKLEASPSEKVTVNMAVDFFTFHGLMTSPLGTYGTSGTSGTSNGESNITSKDVKIDLDRAYVDLYFKHFDISIGKQRVAVGVSYLWAPLDVFNRVNILEPKEEKPGTNAFKLYIPLGSASGLTGIFSPENDFSSSKSGFRAKTQVLGVDAALTLIRWGERETSIYGLDLRGENFIGWWIEAGYFVSADKKHKKIVLGFDYTFPVNRGLYWLNEFYYDSSGEKDSSNYDFQLLFSGDRFTLGQKYFFSMLRYSFSDFLSGSFTYIGNWGDGSYILNPVVQYEISQNVLVSTGFYFPLGPENKEFTMSNRNIFFIWLKINF
ncbi:MAG: hypothetical protein GTO45_12225 [Candidatus Aminicenantes bacterium]|nr:hypothetical protein [Candidatus Aminicenantes bacterium]NIM79569.1 hypothetical protein [Candidatus Aminicenantes bacterium]NIN18875.1 hypothetical protein [Candidatus Aminicenantes bacterium]NIN42788.1 hypothetical protein [Candidatus Aminicenantes bacterium]NIN85515.1 hypothetical protein [Candidatus Aminicenantes bacterium]